MSTTSTVQQAIHDFLDIIQHSRSQNTYRSYANALAFFLKTIQKKASMQDPPLSTIKETAVLDFIEGLRSYSPATEKLYLTALYRFYEFLSASQFVAINLPNVRLLIRQRARRSGQRLPQFPKNKIEEIIKYAINLTLSLPSKPAERLRLLRDRALILTLADTGMRIHEACNLRRGDLDWAEQKAIIIGKGDQQAVVRFSTRALQAIKEYLLERSPYDGSSGKPIAALPIFARHDRGAGKKIKPISTTTGRQIIEHHVRLALRGEDPEAITPHSFRHYFVTTVLRGSGGNIKLAQELARHKSINVTQRYAHLSDDELDRGYHEIFNQPTPPEYPKHQP
ncbi:MAG: hypothetical protein DDG59_03105 [Anaerolineae bacterium]|nr:MAG: hypothetical protein DDG59_03105 [Anaerolineae bacterium]